MSENQEYWFAKVDVAVIRDKTLSLAAKTIFAVLCTFADKDTRGCWPSNKAVAEAAGVTARTVQKAYRELEERGVISRELRFNHNGQTSSYSLIVGHNAPCYGGEACDMGGMNSDSHGTRINEQDIKDYPTGEAELPSSEEIQEIHEMPDEYSPENAPDIMKPTAEYLLLKTGRKNLTWEEISSLRELAANQYPSRVQKEIDRAFERFRRKNRDLKTLTFAYIAGSLRNQPTLGRKRKSSHKPNPPEIRTCSDEQAEAEMAMINAALLEFYPDDEEVRRRVSHDIR